MSKIDNTLIAGPWIGEFGWELFAWQGYIRSLSKHFSKTIVICRDSSRALYEDFADSFVSCNERTGDVDSFFMHNFNINVELKKILLNNKLLNEQNVTLFPPRRIGWPPQTHYSESIKFGNFDIVPSYIKFQNDSNYKYDYVFHARNRNLNTGNNWSHENWKKLLKLLGGNVASIGTKSESLHVSGTDDLRGTSLKETIGIINNTSCVFGPSSGPMHLSSLCATNHVVWGDQNLSQNRYSLNWNPHKTPVLYLDDFKWQPEPEYVYQRFTEWKTKLTSE